MVVEIVGGLGKANPRKAVGPSVSTLGYRGMINSVPTLETEPVVEKEGHLVKQAPERRKRKREV